MIMLQQKWLYNKLVDTSLNLEERLEDILITDISSSLYCVYSELVVAILGDMADIFTYIVFIDNLYQYTNISPYQHINITTDTLTA